MSVTTTTLPVTDHTVVMRTREFRGGPAELSRVLDELREARISGTLHVDIAQGGVASIRFVESSRIEFTVP